MLLRPVESRQFTSVRFTERLDECVRGPDAPTGWADVDELATLGWVHWFNQDRLHSHCGDIPPVEFESAFYADRKTTPTRVGKPNT